MLTVEEWARSLGFSTDATPPAVEDYSEPCHYTAREIAIRAVILQGVVAVAAGVDPEPVIDWFHDQGVSEAVSPNEAAFLRNPAAVDRDQRIDFGWRAEAEWTLMWVVGKVESLGLPIRQCDSRRLVDEIIPPLGSDIAPFLASAELRPSGVLLAEDDRTYNLWCRYWAAHRQGLPLPDDLVVPVLYQRVYALEWLHGTSPWDEVTGAA